MEYTYDSSAVAASATIYYIISIAAAILVLVELWFIFTKANIAGWKCLIPFYNAYCEFKLAWGNGWFFLLLLIPIANIVFYIMFCIKLARSFGKGGGFAVGLIFLGVIFLGILAFNKEIQYVGPNGEPEKITW